MIAKTHCPVTSPWGLGYDTAREGSPIDSCPYDPDTEADDAREFRVGWWEGWSDSQQIAE